MNRLLIKELLNLKNNLNRKPLIIKGARQISKTWLMQTFGQQQLKQLIYLNFKSSQRLQDMFMQDFNLLRIIEVIVIEANQKLMSITLCVPAIKN